MQTNCNMQHAAVNNTATEIMSSGVQHNMPGTDEGENQATKAEDQIKLITQSQTSIDDSPLASTEIPRTGSEPQTPLVTKTTSISASAVTMPHPSGDTIDFAGIFAAQKPNHIKLTPAPVVNGSLTTTCENKSQSKTPTNNNNVSTYHKDGHYFLALVKSEQTRLLAMAEQADHDMYTLTANPGTEISDEVFGILRSFLGKTKLLVSQKFKQFEGLCHSNVNPTPDEKFPTTVEDLQGFWDMVNLQIEHVDSLFKELDLIKANNWQTTKDATLPFVPAGSKLLKRPAVKNGNTNNGTPTSAVRISPNAQLIAQKREAQRKQLLELKRKHKNAADSDKGTLSNTIEIFVSENCL